MRRGLLRDQIASYLGSGAGANCRCRERVDGSRATLDARGVRLCADLQGAATVVETAPYFTDASALTSALGDVPTIILGPGHASMAHQTDEWCECARIEEAVAIYARLIGTGCVLDRPDTIKQAPRRPAVHCDVSIR